MNEFDEIEQTVNLNWRGLMQGAAISITTIQTAIAGRKRSRAERLAAHQARVDRGLKPFHDWQQPDDLIRDRRYAVPVSRWGQDRGARPRDLKQEYTAVGDPEQLQVANVAKDTLDLLLENGSISPGQYDAGREFQKQYDRTGMNRCATTNLTGVSGGGCSREDMLAQAAEARAYLARISKDLGGRQSRQWIALEKILGHRHTLRSIADQDETKDGQSRDVWKGIFLAALETVHSDYKRRMKKSSKKSA